MTIAEVSGQRAGARFGAATSVSVSTPGNVSVGSLVVVTIWTWKSTTNDAFVVGDIAKSAGTATLGAFSLDVNANALFGGSTYLNTAVFSAIVTGAGSLTVQVSGMPSSAYGGIAIDEFTGNWDSSRVEDTSSTDQNTASSAPSSGDMTSAGAALFVGACGSYNAANPATYTPDSPFTNIYTNSNGSTDHTGAGAFAIVTTGTTDAVSWSMNGSERWQAVGVVYKEAPGSEAITEGAEAGDSFAADVRAAATRSEGAVADAAFASDVFASAAIAEGAVAGGTFVGDVVAVTSIVEGAAAGDSFAATVRAAAALSEGALAGDSYNSSVGGEDITESAVADATFTATVRAAAAIAFDVEAGDSYEASGGVVPDEGPLAPKFQGLRYPNVTRQWVGGKKDEEPTDKTDESQDLSVSSVPPEPALPEPVGAAIGIVIPEPPAPVSAEPLPSILPLTAPPATQTPAALPAPEQQAAEPAGGATTQEPAPAEPVPPADFVTWDDMERVLRDMNHTIAMQQREIQALKTQAATAAASLERAFETAILQQQSIDRLAKQVRNQQAAALATTLLKD